MVFGSEQMMVHQSAIGVPYEDQFKGLVQVKVSVRQDPHHIVHGKNPGNGIHSKRPSGRSYACDVLLPLSIRTIERQSDAVLPVRHQARVERLAGF